MERKCTSLLILFFLLPVIIFSFDLLGLATLQEEVSRIATDLSIRVQMEGGLKKEVKSQYEATYSVRIEADFYGKLSYGDHITLVVSKSYESMIFSQNFITIRKERFVWIGFYQ